MAYDPNRLIGFRLGAVTHQHMLSKANAEAKFKLHMHAENKARIAGKKGAQARHGHEAAKASDEIHNLRSKPTTQSEPDMAPKGVKAKAVRATGKGLIKAKVKPSNDDVRKN